MLQKNLRSQIQGSRTFQCYLYVTQYFLKIVLFCKVVTVLLVLQDNNAQQF